MNSSTTRIALICGGTTLAALAIMATSFAQPVHRTPRIASLPSRIDTHPRRVALNHDPFLPLAGGQAAPPKPSTPPAGQNANGTPAGGTQVPNPSGAQANIVLCITSSEPTPLAQFLIGNAERFASIGDDVGGYRIGSIDADGVTMTTGERLVLGMCGQLNAPPPPPAPTTLTTRPADATAAIGQPTLPYQDVQPPNSGLYIKKPADSFGEVYGAPAPTSPPFNYQRPYPLQTP